MSYIPTILVNLDSLLEKSEEVQKLYYETFGEETLEVVAIKALHNDIMIN